MYYKEIVNKNDLRVKIKEIENDCSSNRHGSYVYRTMLNATGTIYYKGDMIEDDVVVQVMAKAVSDYGYDEEVLQYLVEHDKRFSGIDPKTDPYELTGELGEIFNEELEKWMMGVIDMDVKYYSNEAECGQSLTEQFGGHFLKGWLAELFAPELDKYCKSRQLKGWRHIDEKEFDKLTSNLCLCKGFVKA